MAPFLDIILEFFGEIILNKVLSPVIKTPYVLLTWLISFGKIKFRILWKNSNSELYGFLMWAAAIIIVMLYFIFKK